MTNSSLTQTLTPTPTLVLTLTLTLYTGASGSEEAWVSPVTTQDMIITMLVRDAMHYTLLIARAYFALSLSLSLSSSLTLICTGGGVYDM